MMIRRQVRQRAASNRPDALPDDLHPVVRRILLARNVSTKEQLDLRLQGLHPPASLSGLTEAASIIADAVVAEQPILVVGDFDADGATGTAVALRALRAMGAANVAFRVPDRFEFGYGLSVALVETFAEKPPQVLVTVDSGISSLEGVAAARALGCKVVITDHHLPGERLPDAHAIVNPNCPGDDFPSKALAGVGVVFYLMSAVRGALRERNWFTLPRREPQLANLLDLVALGTVADLVPLDYNNRILVKQGIERIRRGLCVPGLLALLRLGKRDYRHLVAADLAFAVAPRLNAAGRLEDMGVGIRCLLSDDRDEADALARELDTLNHERRARQSQMQDEAMTKLQGRLKELREGQLPPGLCLFDPDWHQGIVGLVASRIKDTVHRPVVAFAPEAEGAEVLKGSARSIRGLHIRDVLARVDTLHPGMISAFGGHAMAAGLTLPRAQFEDFEQAFAGVIDTFLGGAIPDNDLLTDGELPPEDINEGFAETLRGLGPWGQRFPEPLFTGHFIVEDRQVVGGSHLKMQLRPPGGRQTLDAIAFGRLPEDLPASATVRFAYRLDINHFRGRKTCQLVIEQILDGG